MLSRVADSIHWMSTYLERAENVARFIEVNLQMILDLPLFQEQTNHWKPLVSITGDDAYFYETYGEATRENVIRFHTFDHNYPNSIISCVTAARENARSIREIISSEMWEQINQFYLLLRMEETNGHALSNPFVFFQEVKTASHLFNGIMDATMTHGEAWNFGHLGGMLERADKTSRILDVKYFILLPKLEYIGTPVDDTQWGVLLKSTSGLEMYRKQYKHISPDNVVDFLILNREFPRSIHFCLNEAEEALSKITGSPPGTYRNQAEQTLGRLRSRMNYTTVAEIFSHGLHEYLDDFQGELNRINTEIGHTFFSQELPRKEEGAWQS
ncbi:alpha-E domain-containing protein [Nitrospina watsonii]|uniref:Alpha-E domain-containing protein n=1 Tax=Nitrospina watsonii TaxID=1323948 RepID=A0ABN8VZS0_9BACT|nr:alpha-E domain-containing protein [Nitrospina watsonii]CAI2719255.1 Alpha-E domain-containing protein [Nitrospina watsonii]